MINYEKKLKQLRKKIIQVSYKTKEGHISPSFSILDILYVLYNDIMELDDNDLLNENNDHLILSKGHASIGLYTVMSDRGFFNEDELLTFAKLGSRLGGHPDRNKVPGVDVSTGSLGHGLPNAVGIAAGLKIKKINSRVFVIVGDG
jgi:transketolase